MSSNSSSSSSSVMDTASITHTFVNLKSITTLSWSRRFSPANKKQVQFQLGIDPNPKLLPGDVLIHLWQAEDESLNLEYEISILNDKKEKCYSKYYRWNYEVMYENNINVTTFMLYSQLMNEANGFLQNDALTLFCQVNILKYRAQISEQNQVLPKMCKDIYSILATGDYSDFVLVVGGKEFRVHKNILGARSSVFKAMFNADLDEKKKNRVEIIDVDLEVFEQLLNYIYSGTVDKLDEYALELFIAADKYQLDELKSICAHFLGSNLTVDTAAKILVLSDMHSAPELKANCIKFITKNSTKVMATNGWKQMMKTRLELVAELYEDIAQAHSALL